MKRKNVILLCLCCCTICIVCATICIVSMLQHKDSSEEFSIIGRWKVDSFVVDGIIVDAQNISAKYDDYGLDYYSNYYYVFNADGSAMYGVLDKRTAGDYTIETLAAEERAVLLEAGTEIIFMPFVPGLSTTGIVEKILRTR